MKKLFYLIALCFFGTFFSQQKIKDYSSIMKSNSIYEIDAFLRDAHPDDPKRFILKPRLIKMLKDYIKTAHPSDQRVKEFQEKIALLRRKSSTRISFDEMNENIRQRQIEKFKKELSDKGGAQAYVTKSYGSAESTEGTVSTASGSSAGMSEDEAAEFQMLMSENPTEHKNKTVKILNSLFDLSLIHI